MGTLNDSVSTPVQKAIATRWTTTPVITAGNRIVLRYVVTGEDGTTIVTDLPPALMGDICLHGLRSCIELDAWQRIADELRRLEIPEEQVRELLVRVSEDLLHRLDVSTPPPVTTA